MSLSHRKDQLGRFSPLMSMEPIRWPAANRSWLAGLKKIDGANDQCDFVWIHMRKEGRVHEGHGSNTSPLLSRQCFIKHFLNMLTTANDCNERLFIQLPFINWLIHHFVFTLLGNINTVPPQLMKICFSPTFNDDNDGLIFLMLN